MEQDLSTDRGLPTGTDEAVAVNTGSAAWTWSDLSDAADGLSGHISELVDSPAAPRRVRIGHVCDLSPAAIVGVHAVARSGGVLAPGHVGWSAAQVNHWLATVQPDAVLLSAGQPWPQGGARHAVSLPGFGPLDLFVPVSQRPPAGHEPVGQEAAGREPAGTDVMITTSGSGGVPRVVCHSWATLRANARAANRRSGCTPDSVTFAALAWAHVGGLAIIVRSAEAGGRIVCGPERFDAQNVAEALERHGVTHVSVVPVMLDRLLDTGVEPPQTLERILTGGAATPERLIERALAAGWPLSLTYGLTEAGSQVATISPDEVARRVAVLDRPLENMEVGLGEGSELLVRGESLLLGYLDGTPAVDAEGWFSTGDFAAEDETGSLKITGRRSSRIVTGGSNVDAEEVEAVLRDHDSVDDVCVVGIADDRWGELVTAVIVSNAGNRSDLVGALDTWARGRLDGPRRPRRWLIVDQLPRTPTGKIDRVAVRERAAPGDDPAGS